MEYDIIHQVNLQCKYKTVLHQMQIGGAEEKEAGGASSDFLFHVIHASGHHQGVEGYRGLPPQSS